MYTMGPPCPSKVRSLRSSVQPENFDNINGTNFYLKIWGVGVLLSAVNGPLSWSLVARHGTKALRSSFISHDRNYMVTCAIPFWLKWSFRRIRIPFTASFRKLQTGHFVASDTSLLINCYECNKTAHPLVSGRVEQRRRTLAFSACWSLNRITSRLFKRDHSDLLYELLRSFPGAVL